MNIETKAQNELKEVLALAKEKGRTDDGSFVMKQLAKRGWQFKSYIRSSETMSETSHHCGYHGIFGAGVMHKVGRF